MGSIIGPIRRSVLAAAIRTAAVLPFAQAQARFPGWPVKVIVPTRAGGGAESTSTLIYKEVEG